MIVLFFILTEILILLHKNWAMFCKSVFHGQQTTNCHFILARRNLFFIGPPRKLKNVSDFKILCDGHVIKGSDSVKYSGLCIGFSRVKYCFKHYRKSKHKCLYRNGSCFNTQSRKVLSSDLVQCFSTMPVLSYMSKTLYMDRCSCVHMHLHVSSIILKLVNRYRYYIVLSSSINFSKDYKLHRTKS